MFLKFDKDDVFHNVIKTHPSCSFHVHRFNVYYKNRPGVTDVSGSNLDLYELNVNRSSWTDAENNKIGGDLAYPFVTKEGAKTAFKTISASTFDDSSQFNWGSVLKGEYPLTASISRIYVKHGENINPLTHNNSATEALEVSYSRPGYNKKYINALKVALDAHVKYSEHFAFTSSGGHDTWNKGNQSINMICVPSIFYGSSIKPGSVKLTINYAGVPQAYLQATKKNGELIQVSGSTGEGDVAGVVLYEHGLFLLTASWTIASGGNLSGQRWTGNLSDNGLSVTQMKWLHYGWGIPLVGEQEVNSGGYFSPSSNFHNSASYSLDFQGTNYVPTLTMMAHARQGEINYSNNPTYVDYDSRLSSSVTEHGYVETQPMVKNTIKSNFKNSEAKFEKQVYITKVGIYDKDKNLIAIANLANPVKKRETQDYTFKLKLDF